MIQNFFQHLKTNRRKTIGAFILLIFVAGQTAFKTYQSSQSLQPVEGEIYRLAETSKLDRVTPFISYSFGTEHFIKSYSREVPQDKFKVGEKITLEVDPKDPGNAELRGENFKYWPSVTLLLLVLLVLGIEIGMLKLRSKESA